METLHVCRRSNGTIDIDHYRQQAMRERAAVFSAVLGRSGRHVRPAFAMLAIVVTICAMPAVKPSVTGPVSLLQAPHTVN